MVSPSTKNQKESMKSKLMASPLLCLGMFAFGSNVSAEDLMNPIQTALSSTTISGYVDTSVEWTLNRLDPTGLGWDSWPSTIPFRDPGKADGFNLNVVKLSIEKPLDESEWASGYKADLLFGPDAVAYNPSANGDMNESFAVKQAYVALRAPVGNGIDWKLGTFDTVIGYETFEAGNNPNFTRSWGYAIEPTQHTGILGTYRINDRVAIAAGVANTLSAGINNRNNPNETWHKAYLASIVVTAPDDCSMFGGSTWYAGAVGGFAGGPDDQQNFYTGVTLNTPVNGLRTGIAFDYVENLGGTDGVSDYQDDAWVMGFYFSYQATEKLSLHARGEYGDLRYKLTIPGFDDRGHEYMTGLTGTVQYDLWKNVLSRIEVRWDQMHTKGTTVDIGTTEYDYVNATQMGVYANFIYKF